MALDRSQFGGLFYEIKGPRLCKIHITHVRNTGEVNIK